MSREKDPTGDKLKAFEIDPVLDPTLPIILRLDGRAFHTWTRCVDRPYDPRLNGLMHYVMVNLAVEANARYAYTQSDEITLVLLAEGKAQPLFGARTQKLCSLLASLASAVFNTSMHTFDIPYDVFARKATFDCRAYNVPDRATAAEVVLWREADAIRNSSLGRGQEFMSANQLHGKSAKEVRAHLASISKTWGELPPERKFGSAVHRRAIKRKFYAEEIEKLPAKHEARTNPDLEVLRHELMKVELPLRWTCSNAEGVIFDGELPRPREAVQSDED